MGLKVRTPFWAGLKVEWDENGDHDQQHPEAYPGSPAQGIVQPRVQRHKTGALRVRAGKVKSWPTGLV